MGFDVLELSLVRNLEVDRNVTRDTGEAGHGWRSKRFERETISSIPTRQRGGLVTGTEENLDLTPAVIPQASDCGVCRHKWE